MIPDGLATRFRSRPQGARGSSARPQRIKLRSGGLAATILCGAHLTIESLSFRGRELLIAPGSLPDVYCVHGTRAGITLLHPLTAIHEVASEASWEIERRDRHACHVAGWSPPVAGFPFRHRVEVTIELSEISHLSIETTVAAGDAPVAVGFGWRSYFRLDELADGTLVLPGRRPTRLELGEEGLDASYAQISDGATFTLLEPDRAIHLTHDFGFPCAEVFAPRDAPLVSLEPTTAPTDDLRTGSGLSRAELRMSYAARFSLDIEA